MTHRNPSAFRKWMIAGPEQAQLLKEFEHEEGFSTQKAFNQRQHLVKTISEMGNSFFEAIPELLVVDIRDVIDESAVKTVQHWARTNTKVNMNQSSRTALALNMMWSSFLIFTHIDMGTI